VRLAGQRPPRADLLLRQIEHDVEHHVLHDRPQAAGARLLAHRLAGDRVQGLVGELQLAVLQAEHLLILLDERVLRLLENFHERMLVERLQRGDHRQPPHQFGDQAELEDVVRVDLRQQFGQVGVGTQAGGLAEADRPLPEPPRDDLLDAHERPAANEEDVRSVDLDVLLLGMLASPLRRHVGHGALEHLQQRLLHSLARHVPGDRDVLAGLSNLVDLVDVEHAPLGGLDVEVGRVEQLEKQVFHVFADVARLGEGGRVADRERHVENPGQRPGEQRLARAGRPEEEDVRLVDLDVTGLAAEVQPLVVAVNGDGQHPLGMLLPDDVLVEMGHDLPRRGDRREELLAAAPAPLFLVEDRLAEVDAFATDVDVPGPFDERPDVAVTLAAEGAEGILFRRAPAPRRPRPPTSFPDGIDSLPRGSCRRAVVAGHRPPFRMHGPVAPAVRFDERSYLSVFLIAQHTIIAEIFVVDERLYPIATIVSRPRQPLLHHHDGHEPDKNGPDDDPAEPQRPLNRGQIGNGRDGHQNRVRTEARTEPPPWRTRGRHYGSHGRKGSSKLPEISASAGTWRARPRRRPVR